MTLLNILAYLSARPNFVAVDNTWFNQRVDELYKYFDLTECLDIRRNVFFSTNKPNVFSLELPALKNTRSSYIVEIGKMENTEILELYHASLKQFEPIPRCIMLWRVVECAFEKYKSLFKLQYFEPKDAVNYFWDQLQVKQLNPLYCVYYVNQEKKVVNLLSLLKKETVKIEREWKNNKYVKNKSIGEIIYLTGRNFSAHGANRERNARYDYSKNYKHINDINIFLELIARYIVEWLNPNIKNMVLKNKNIYLSDTVSLILKR